MPAVNRKDIRDAVIFRADLPAAEPRRVTDVQLDTLIARSLLRLQGVLTRFDSEDYFKIFTEHTLTAGTNIPLEPTSKIIHVMWKLGNSGDQRDYIPLQASTREAIARRGATTQKWDRTDPPTYLVADGADGARELRFIPKSTVDEDLLLVTQKQYILADDTETIDLDFAWEEWVILDALIMIRQRDKQDGTDLVREREKTEQLIRETSPEVLKDRRLAVIDREDPLEYAGLRWWR